MKWQIPPYLQLAFAPLSSKNLTICWCPALVQWNKAVQPWMSFISSSAPCFKRTEKVLYCTLSPPSLCYCLSALWYQTLNPCQEAELTTEHKWHTLVATGRESYPVHLNHALWLYLFLMGYTPVEESKQHFHFHSWRPAWVVSALLVWGCSHSLPLPAAGAQWCRGRCRRHTSVESSHHNSSYLNPDLH